MMEPENTQNTPAQVELKGFLSEFRDALEEESVKVKKRGQSSTPLANGRRIESRGRECWRGA